MTDIDENGNVTAFPTHVGMNRSWRLKYNNRYCVPHTRGDEPLDGTDGQVMVERSPHTWG